MPRSKEILGVRSQATVILWPAPGPGDLFHVMLWEVLRAVTIFNRQRMGHSGPVKFPEEGYTDFEGSLLIHPVAGVFREGELA